MDVIAKDGDLSATYKSGGWGESIAIWNGSTILNEYSLDGKSRLGPGRYMSDGQKNRADELARKAAKLL